MVEARVYLALFSLFMMPGLVACAKPKARVNMNPSIPFGIDQARSRVEERVASIPPLADADITHAPDLDVAGMYAFSVMPRAVGKAGEVIYLVGPDELLTAGAAEVFDKLMERLGVGKTPNVLDVPTFAHLFLRIRVLRHGALLERPDGHPLMRSRQLPARQFAAPHYEFGPHGARYRFWVFDTDHFVPVSWDVRIAPNGATTFTTEELR
jgi:hypothetical protein